jgi:hypothetical protein
MKKHIAITCIVIVSTLSFFSQSKAGERTYYYYRNLSYGSESLYNPVTLLLNGGFDTFQMLDRQPTWNNMYWDHAATNVWRCATSPLPIINSFTWKKFVGQELLPTSLDIDNCQYVPNYLLHTLGGGMEYRKISEWYDAHNYPLPDVCGALTTMTYEYLNEITENGMNYYSNEDCIPDLLIFQPFGILLFSFDNIAEFFSTTVSLNDWSNPVGMTFSPFAIRNAAQNFIVKVPLNQAHTLHAVSLFGSMGMLGLSVKTNNEDAITVAGGLTSTGRVDLPSENGVPSNTISLGPVAGVYYDRNNSLLASATYSAAWNNRFRINVFPGALSIKSFSPGFFVICSGGGDVTAGIVMQVLPIGVGGYFSR